MWYQLNWWAFHHGLIMEFLFPSKAHYRKAAYRGYNLNVDKDFFSLWGRSGAECLSCESRPGLDTKREELRCGKASCNNSETRRVSRLFSGNHTACWLVPKAYDNHMRWCHGSWKSLTPCFSLAWYFCLTVIVLGKGMPLTFAVLPVISHWKFNWHPIVNGSSNLVYKS